MHYVVQCLDHADALPIRLANYEAHKAYLAGVKINILISGPLIAEDGETMIGSFFLIGSDDRSAVEAFNAEDPFNKAGIWRQVTINRFLKRVDKRS